MGKKMDVSKKDNKELSVMLGDKKKELFETKINVQKGEHKAVSDISKIKKDIARINTALNNKQLQEVK